MQFATIVALFAALAVAKRSHRAAGPVTFNVSNFKAKCESNSGGHCTYSFTLVNASVAGDKGASCTKSVENTKLGLLPPINDTPCDNGAIWSATPGDGTLLLKAKQGSTNGQYTIAANDIPIGPNTGIQEYTGSGNFALNAA